MYTNGFTHQPYCSVVSFKDSTGRTHCWLDHEFAAESEHVTMETLQADEFMPETVIAHNGSLCESVALVF